MDNPPTQVCTKCGEEKPLDAEHFPHNHRTKTGFLNRCRPCHREAKKVSKRKHKKRIYEANRLYDIIRAREKRKRQRSAKKAVFTRSLGSKANSAWVVKKPEKLLKNGFETPEVEKPALEEFEDIINE